MWPPCRKTSAKTQGDSAQFHKKLKTFSLCKQKSFLQNVPLDTNNAILTSYPGTFWERTAKLPLEVWKQIIGIYTNFRGKDFWKRLLWTGRKQFWQLCRHNFARCPRLFTEIAYITKKKQTICKTYTFREKVPDISLGKT